MKKIIVWTFCLSVALLPVRAVPVMADADSGGNDDRWVIEDVLGSETVPFAIGHRGYGENLGEDPDRPIENTAKAVRRAFRDGVQIVEVDVVLTGDNVAVALHDDFLGDLTCVNSLTLPELKDRLGDVSSLRSILQTARTYSNETDSDRPAGQVLVEIKNPSPLCDPGDETVGDLVRAVVGDIDFTRMADQVMVESYSPEALDILRDVAPDIRRMLVVSMLQLLTPEQIEAATGLPVVLTAKDAGFGLQWGEIGPLYRLPGYSSIDQYVGTLMALQSRAASMDKLILAAFEQVLSGSGAFLVLQLHQLGMEALVWTAEDELEWYFLLGLGVDGIYVDDVPMGLSLE